MNTILAITVGGSCAPIVTAIKDHKPDFVAFFASSGSRGSRNMIDGDGKPCSTNREEPAQPNILKQTSLPKENYQIVELSNPDALADCYKEIRNGLKRCSNGRESWQRIADYTGGTKTMSVALSLAALEAGWKLSIVKGTRADLISVSPGTEMAALVNTWEVQSHQRIREAWNLFNQYAFSSAGELLEILVRTAPLSPDLESEIMIWVALCRAFDAWDKFDHQKAYKLLEPYSSKVSPQWLFLKSLLAKMEHSGYEPVFDLLYNAERRASRGRYDDAVARLYRAMELLAQIRLRSRNPPIDTSNVKIEDLPETIQEEYQKIADLQSSLGKNKKIKLGLVEAYELLAKMDDPLGKAFQNNKKNILSLLEKRNASILAHGNNPLSDKDYQAMREQTECLLNDCIERINKIEKVTWVQFPGIDVEEGKIIQSSTTRES